MEREEGAGAEKLTAVQQEQVEQVERVKQRLLPSAAAVAITAEGTFRFRVQRAAWQALMPILLPIGRGALVVRWDGQEHDAEGRRIYR